MSAVNELKRKNKVLQRNKRRRQCSSASTLSTSERRKKSEKSLKFKYNLSSLLGRHVTRRSLSQFKQLLQPTQIENDTYNTDALLLKKHHFEDASKFIYSFLGPKTTVTEEPYHANSMNCPVTFLKCQLLSNLMHSGRVLRHSFLNDKKIHLTFSFDAAELVEGESITVDSLSSPTFPALS